MALFIQRRCRRREFGGKNGVQLVLNVFTVDLFIYVFVISIFEAMRRRTKRRELRLLSLLFDADALFICTRYDNRRRRIAGVAIVISIGESLVVRREEKSIAVSSDVQQRGFKLV